MKRVPLKRKTPLARTPFRRSSLKRHRTTDAKAEALARDGGCVAPALEGPGACWGDLEFDHVADHKGMGIKGPDRADHGQIGCVGHHKGKNGDGGWLTTKVARQRSRERLDLLHPTRHIDADCFTA